MGDVKRKILLLIGIPNFNYWNQNSAVLSYLQDIRKVFESEGNSVYFANELIENQPQEQEVKDTPILKKGISSIAKSWLRKWPWFYQTLSFKRFFKNQNNLKLALLKMPAMDLVIEFHTVGSTIGLALAAKWDCEFNVIFDSPVGEQFVEMYHTRSAFWSKIESSEKNTIESANKILVYSPACKEYLQEKYEVKAKINILPCMIQKPTQQERERTDQFNVGFIGSFLSWHKVNILVETFAKFNEIHPDSQLFLIGYGVEWDRINKKVESLDLKEAVKIPGFVSDDELEKYKARMTVAVMPGSNWYGSPLKLFEYAQAGIPFIAPESKTVSSIFQKDVHCLYVDSTNESESLLKALVLLEKDEEKRNQLATNAQRLMEAEYHEVSYSKLIFSHLN